MIDPWTIYLITRMDAVCDLLMALCLLLILPGVVALIAILVAKATAQADIRARLRSPLTAEEINSTKKDLRRASFAIFVGMICGTARVAVPTTNELAAIWLIPKLANSEVVQQEAGEVYQLAKQWLSEQVDSSK